MPDRTDWPTHTLETYAGAILPLLQGIHAELKRANDLRDAWATAIYDVLKTAKEEE